MTPTKLLIGQILIVFAIVLAGLWASTQWIAVYASAYGREEPVADLVPAMLVAFLEGDRAFARSRSTSK